MTTLVVDIGNARIKWASVETAGLIATGSASHRGSPDEALEALAAAWPERVERVIVANVAGDSIAAKLGVLTNRLSGIDPRFVTTTQTRLGVRCGYRDPERLGVDRWMAVIAAHRIARSESGGPRPACVISAGTALTLDAVDAQGQHLGGLIMAGPRIAADALQRNTQRIGPTVGAIAVPVGLDLFGKSTDEAVGHAALLGPAAAFDRAIRVLTREIGAPSVFLAGGDAPLLAPWLETQPQERADLVLEGLALIAAEAPRNGRGQPNH